MGLIAPAGGGGLTGGIAQGQIRIDTHSLAQSRAQVIREARLMADGLRGIGDAADQGVKRADSAFTRLSATINGAWRTTSLLLGIIATMGVKGAQSVKMLEIRFRMLAGSQEAANEQLAMLRELSEDLGQPFLDVAEGATAIMPALRGTNASLKDTIMLVQRLAILDPVQGVSGAAFAVREFLNGEYLSLVRRLELDRKRLQSIRAEADGDQAKMIEGLSQYIDEIGITNDQLAEMGKSGAYTFQVLRSEGTETLALFFTPFLNDVIIPLTRAFGDFLRELRKTSPELQRFIGIAGGLAALAAVGQNGLPLIGKIPGGATLGKAGLLAGTVYAGAQAGAYISRKSGVGETAGMTQSGAMDRLWERLKQMVFLVASAGIGLAKVFVNLTETLDNAGLDLEKAWQGAQDKLMSMWTDFIKLLDMLPGVDVKTVNPVPENAPGMGTSKLNQPGAELPPSAQRNLVMGDVMTALTGVYDAFHASGRAAEEARTKYDDWNDELDAYLLTLGEGLGVIDENRTAAEVLNEAYQKLTGTIRGAIAGAAGAAGANEPTITDDLLAGYAQYKDDMAEIEREANEAILEENAQYEARKAELIRSYAESVTRFLEDEAIRYARALADAQRREQDIRATLQTTLADASTELAASVADLNEDYAREQERATRDHLARLRDIQEDGRESIMTAASRLDAVGVWEALRTMQKRTKDEKDSFARQEEDRRDQLAQALADEKENYTERVQAAQDHAEQQIRQLWEQFHREEQERREDNARRIEQMRQAHQRELGELRAHHIERVEEIRIAAAREKQARYEQWLKEFNDAQTHNGTMLTLQQEGEKMLEDELKAWWTRMRDDFAAQNALWFAQQKAGQIASGIRNLLSFDTGGRIPRTGLFKGARDEEVLRPDVARTLRRMMGGEINQSGLVAAYGRGGGGSRSVSVGDINIYVPHNKTNDLNELGKFIRQEVREQLGELVAG